MLRVKDFIVLYRYFLSMPWFQNTDRVIVKNLAFFLALCLIASKMNSEESNIKSHFIFIQFLLWIVSLSKSLRF